MIDPTLFYQQLNATGIDFFCGVPDSLLKHLCSVIQELSTPKQHVIAANEGNALALGIGHYLATKKPALVYLQNSGLGNLINPLISLAAKEVYGIPALLLIGWRGEPNLKDEPQHLTQGAITEGLLKLLDVPYFIIDQNTQNTNDIIKAAYQKTLAIKSPVAILCKKNTFSPYKKTMPQPQIQVTLKREEVIKHIASSLNDDTIVVATTGAASRELYEYRWDQKNKIGCDFYTVGGMGHASQIALGIAMQTPQKQVVCLDGDGAALMHMGALAINANQPVTNFKHIILNNGCHDSVGGQPTVGKQIDFTDIATGCGYQTTIKLSTAAELAESLPEFISADGPALLEIAIMPGTRKDLMVPATSPYENKQTFMEYVTLCPSSATIES